MFSVSTTKLGKLPIESSCRFRKVFFPVKKSPSDFQKDSRNFNSEHRGFTPQEILEFRELSFCEEFFSPNNLNCERFTWKSPRLKSGFHHRWFSIHLYDLGFKTASFRRCFWKILFHTRWLSVDESGRNDEEYEEYDEEMRDVVPTYLSLSGDFPIKRWWMTWQKGPKIT